MIKINGKLVNQEHFPDGSLRILDLQEYTPCSKEFQITWNYENDSELFTLWSLVCHLRQNYGKNVSITLNMPFCPHSRMDRVKEKQEVFTLKYFADFINLMNFDNVCVLDPHSNVTTALIDRIVEMDVSKYINTVLYKLDMRGFKNKNIAVYFPDAGAMKRYKDLPLLKNKPMFYGKKVRDWKTGVITELCIYDQDGTKVEAINNDFSILMIDDIISYGGTMAYSADKLKALGANKIFAYATHVENSILDEEKGTLLKRLKDGTVEKVFTTNSLFNKKSEFIEII